MITPGPWVKSGHDIYDTDGRVLVAEVVQGPDRADPFVFDSEDDCNAFLIAAAPEMLGALESIEAWAQEFGCAASSKNCPVYKVRKAIDKAKGRVDK